MTNSHFQHSISFAMSPFQCPYSSLPLSSPSLICSSMIFFLPFDIFVFRGKGEADKSKYKSQSPYKNQHYVIIKYIQTSLQEIHQKKHTISTIFNNLISTDIYNDRVLTAVYDITTACTTRSNMSLSFTLLPDALVQFHALLICFAKFNESIRLEASRNGVGFIRLYTACHWR